MSRIKPFVSLRGKALGQVLPSHGSFLKNLDMFDHTEFGVASKDARAMPVGTRKLLELVGPGRLDLHAPSG
jgi:acyl transferase domain-containing protein